MRLQGLAAVIQRFANEQITISRPGASTYDANGVANTASSTTSTTAAHVERPASNRDLLHLPEGDRVRRSCSVWSVVELRHRDLITLADGEVYELQSVEPWDQLAGFWKGLGLKVQQ